MFPCLLKQIEDSILLNPYDNDREEFVVNCLNNISYFKNVDKSTLRRLFYNVKYKFIQPDEYLFEALSLCTNIYILTYGILDIVISNQNGVTKTLDCLGVNSIIGQQFILNNEKWPYSGFNKTTASIKVIIISHDVLKRFGFYHPEVREAMGEELDARNEEGFSQIDYIVKVDSIS